MKCVIRINGREYLKEGERKLMDVLRNDLGLRSVKDGCSEGACGTCTVIAGGKAIKACVQKVALFEGREIITAEGLSEREKEVFTYAFGSCGSVQCGFCIPGMIMCAKALIDGNPDPSREEVIRAIRGNLCRCTGYQKIIEGILLAAKMLREDIRAKPEPIRGIGQRAYRIDSDAKVLGYGEYVDDMQVEGMLYGGALRSRYARARILSINTKKAKELPGIEAVLKAEDIPGCNQIGHIKKDWYTLIPEGEITKYAGDALVLIAAKTPELLEEAKKLIEVEYEELEGVYSAEEALREDAPKVHEKSNLMAHEVLKRGDADKAIAEAAFVVSNTYLTPASEHAFLEPEAALAMVDKKAGKAKIYSSDQSTYQTAHECAMMLGFKSEDIHVVNKLVGGGFGGKEDMSVQHHAALLSYHTGLPVKVRLSRQESIQVHPKRHQMVMKFTTACDKDGYLTAMKAELIADTGAYASLGGPVLQRACTHAAGPYHYQNIYVDGKAVYTNNPPAGAFRGFGVTQSCFATECNITMLAQKLGMSPWEFRYKNAIRPGQELPNGQIATASTALAQTLEAVKEVYEKEKYAGIACAMKNSGVGVGLPDWGRCLLKVEGGKVHIFSGASDIGQGLGTVLVQFVCETLKITGDDVVYEDAQTNYAPDSGVTSGSRQTLITGEATIRACKELLKDLEGKKLEDLNGREYYGEYLAATDPMGSAKKNPVSHVAYGYATHVVVLNEDGSLKKVVAAHDVGRAINPMSTEGQIEGGVVMSLGFALTEKFPTEKGIPKVKLGTMGIFKADKVPEIESILIENNPDSLAYGAIGIGEIVCIPTAPAVQAAYYRYDKVFRKSLPLENTAYRK